MLAQSPRLGAWTSRRPGSTRPRARAFGATIRTLPDRGVSVLLVDHDMGLVLGVCDVVYVVDEGGVIAVGTPAEIRRNERVIAAYLGAAGQGAP